MREAKVITNNHYVTTLMAVKKVKLLKEKLNQMTLREVLQFIDEIGGTHQARQALNELENLMK